MDGYVVDLHAVPPQVMDSERNPVPNSWVLRVRFPEVSSETPQGTIWHLAGPGTAEILVSGNIFIDVPILP
jgi:hypothetical protein